MKKILFLITFFIGIAPVLALEVPKLTRPVEDLVQVLTVEDKNQIEEKIRAIYEKKQAQISVLIISSLENEVLEDYSIKVAEQWKLGTEKEDNGILILLAMKERKIRIEVGNGVEGVITDLLASRMIEAMGSYMRKQEYGQAILNTVDTISQKFAENTPEAIAQRKAELEQLAKEREESMKNLANGFVWLLNGFILIVALKWFYFFLVSAKKEKNHFLAAKKQAEENINKTEKSIEETQGQLAKVKVDQVKFQYLNKVEQVETLEAEKSRLESSIATMKRYLGV
jgi:uncharacterized membrane protein YgcG